MHRFSSSALTRLHKFLLDLHATHDSAELRARIATNLPRLVACDHANFNDARLNGARTSIRPTPLPAWWAKLGAVYEGHVGDHPCLNPRHPPALLQTVSLADRAYAQAWNKCVLRHEYFVPLGVNYQLSAICHRHGDSFVALGINRHRRDFTATDRQLVDLVNPHIALAWRNALTVDALLRTRHPARGGLAALIEITNEDNRVRSLSPDGSQILTRHFGHDTSGGARLPESLERWVRAQRARRDTPEAAAEAVAPFVATTVGWRLMVRVVQMLPEAMLLLLDDHPAEAFGNQPEAGLSPREREVMHWVAEGKRNAEIAVILALSPRTVEKHVERILGKFGVETRAGAISHVLAANRTHHG